MKVARVCASSAVLLFFGSVLMAQAPRRRSQTVLFPPTGNFQNPGARSLGLGGAFIGLADDASASELNPAGLTQLRKPELALEFRRRENTTVVDFPNSLTFGEAECVYLGSDSGGGCRTTFSSRLDSLGFASLIVPVGRRLTLALYRHELDREKSSVFRPALDLPDRQAAGTFEELDRRITRTGLAVAYLITDRLSAGVTLNINAMNQSFRAVEFFTDFAGGPPSFVSAIQDAHIESEKLGGTAGLYWRPIDLISVGASYSTRVEFVERAVRQICPSDPDTGLPKCFFSGGVPDPGNVYFLEGLNSSFTLPSRLGVSIAVRPTRWLLLIGEGDRVTYSDNNQEQARFDNVGNVIGLDRFVAKDVWELRAGLEAVVPFARSGLLALRLGYWRDPDHSFRYAGCQRTGPAACDSDPFAAEPHPPTGDLHHYAGGVGVAWSWGQVDVGYDWIARYRRGTLAVSLVVRGN